MKMAFSPHFYLLRLRHSSLPELFYRIWQNIALYHLKGLKRLGGPFLKTPEIVKSDIQKLAMPDLILETKIGSEDILNSIDWEHFQNPWHLNPIATITDIRTRWEPARLQQVSALITFAHHYPEAQECNVAKKAARTIVLHWINTNSFLEGEHYLSAMECALRVPVFFYALKRLDNLTPGEFDLVLEALYAHTRLISKHLSLYSSLGNHTITEAVGLIFGGAVYQSTREGRRWLQTGLRLLSDELPHQILDDGGPAEQSLGYHRFVLDLYWLAMDFIQKNKLGSVSDWKPRLSTGEFFLNAFQDSHGCLPSIGDNDNGVAIAPGTSPARVAVTCADNSWRIFKHSGYSIIRNDQLLLTFDHGPLGMAPFYNHGHADALSITLTKNGRPLIVDPGTYRYNGATKWRRYFKGTRAHNTVNVDNQDQAVQETSFIWSKPYTARSTAHHEENGQLFCAAIHDGYMRLKNPLRHQRSVFVVDQANFLVRDRFFGTGMHCFQLNFHLHPNAVVTKDSNWWIVAHDGEQARLRLFEGDFQVVRGQTNPLMGWFSSHYGKKEPTMTLTFSRLGNAASIVFTTAIVTQPAHNQW